MKDNWTRCMDKLPEAETLVWAVWRSPKQGRKFVADAWINEHEQWTNEEAVLTSMGYWVSHWMEKEPTPAPPEDK